MVGTAYLDDRVSQRWQDAYRMVPVLAKEYPNQETILGKNPDFLAASYASAFEAKVAGNRQDLAELGIATYVSPFACEDKSQRPKVAWEAVYGEITDIATLFGDPRRAEPLITEQKRQVTDVIAAAPAKGKTIFWYDSGTKEPYVGASQGAPQLIIDSLGGTNIFVKLPGNWADGSWEAVLSADPDVIVLADASWDTAEQKEKYLKSDPALRDLTAVKNDAFLVVPFSATTPGVRNAEGLVALSEQLSSLR
jgi:iron complex transport system substrate-binding protein